MVTPTTQGSSLRREQMRQTIESTTTFSVKNGPSRYGKWLRQVRRAMVRVASQREQCRTHASSAATFFDMVLERSQPHQSSEQVGQAAAKRLTVVSMCRQT